MAWALVAAANLATATASAAPAPTGEASEIRLSEALALANDALRACAERQAHASVSIVDAHGVVKATLRDDGAEKAPVAAPLKAATAVAFRSTGADLSERIKSDAALAAEISNRPDLYNAHPGSAPIYRHGVLIGAIAVADVDHEIADTCVREALSKFQRK